MYNLQTLGGWYSSNGIIAHNCTHAYSAYQEGFTPELKPALDDAKNAELYANNQKLRYLERKTREAKRLEAAAMDPVAARQARAKVATYQAKIREHVNRTGVRRQNYREQISGGPKGTQAAKLQASHGPLPSARSRGFGDWETQTAHELDLKDAMGTGSREDAIHLKAEVRSSIDERLAEDKDWQSAKGWLEQRYRSLDPNEEGWTPTLSSDWISQWAFSSGDSHPESIALQLAAREEFGLAKASLAHIDAATMEEATKIFDEIGPGLQKFLRAQYDNTQEWFARQGVTEVTAYRGMQLADRAIVDAGLASAEEMATAPLSSFTADLTTAHHFTGGVISGHNADSVAVIASRVPVSRILSIPRTGLGCLNERELVVLGGRDKTAQFAWSRSGLSEFLRDSKNLRGVNEELDWLVEEDADVSDLTYVEAVFRAYLQSLD